MIQFPGPDGQLTVVADLAGIEDAFQVMVENPMPGFQIAPEVDRDESLEVLAGLMQTAYDPTFRFNDLSGDLTGQTNSAAEPHPHVDPVNLYIDNGRAHGFSGIAVHENKGGYGVVDLQLVEPAVTTAKDIEDNSLVGPCLRGALKPNMKTVFSERIYDARVRRIILGATFHVFRTQGNSRRWCRNAYSPSKAEITAMPTSIQQSFDPSFAE